MVTIDTLYAANLEELQSVLQQLSETAKREQGICNADTPYHPSIVQFGGMQLQVSLGADTLTDGSTVFDVRFQFHALCN